MKYLIIPALNDNRDLGIEIPETILKQAYRDAVIARYAPLPYMLTKQALS